MYTCIFSIKNLDLAVPMKNKREHKSSTYSSWAKNIKMLIIEKNYNYRTTENMLCKYYLDKESHNLKTYFN